jgi:hypothetical protein
MQLKTHVKAGFAVSQENLPAGPIRDDADAAGQCRRVCGTQGGCATGEWVTTVPGEMSVCGCIFPYYY